MRFTMTTRPVLRSSRLNTSTPARARVRRPNGSAHDRSKQNQYRNDVSYC